MSILNAKDIFEEALNLNPNDDINSLNNKAYGLIIKEKTKYYENKVESLLSETKMPEDVRKALKTHMLSPKTIKNKRYFNLLEEAVVPFGNSVKTTTGKIAELCVQTELKRRQLEESKHFSVKKGRGPDIIMYHPDRNTEKSRHRIEVKNINMRERAHRAWVESADSLIGFFQSDKEVEGQLDILEEIAKSKKGYCYLPSETFKKLKKGGKLKSTTRIKPHGQFGQDMVRFNKTGKI